MDIEEFYDADPRRRESEEIEFGREWSDASGMRTELSWVAATGELYAMAEPSESVDMDPVGDTRVDDLPTELAHRRHPRRDPRPRAEIDQLLAGWEGEMEKGPTASSGCATASRRADHHGSGTHRPRTDPARAGSSAKPCSARKTPACSRDAAATTTTSLSRACCTPTSCAATSPGRRSRASTSPRRAHCRAWSRCSPPPTSTQGRDLDVPVDVPGRRRVHVADVPAGGRRRALRRRSDRADRRPEPVPRRRRGRADRDRLRPRRPDPHLRRRARRRRQPRPPEPSRQRR